MADIFFILNNFRSSLPPQKERRSCSGVALLRGEDEGDDKPVETQDLGEDQDEDHAHEEPRLLSRAPHAGVAHDADGEAGRQPAEAHAESSAEVEETPAHRNER